MEYNLKKKEGFSLLLVVLCGFCFLAIISYAFMTASTSERKQLIYNLEGDRARALAEAGLKSALTNVLENANSAETEIYKWFRNANDKKPAGFTVKVKDDALKLFPDMKGRVKMEVDDVKVEMEVLKAFPDNAKNQLDSDKLEKNGMVKLTVKSKYGSEKFQIIAAYDFKVALIMFPQFKSGQLKDTGQLNKFAVLIRGGKSYIDGKPELTPEMKVVNDELQQGFLAFGNNTFPGFTGTPEVDEVLEAFGSDSDVIEIGTSEVIANFKYKNTKFMKFNTKYIYYNNPELSKLENLDLTLSSIPYEKVARWFITGDSFLDFSLRDSTLKLDGIELVDDGFTLTAALSFEGYSLTLTKNAVNLRRAVEKKGDNSGWLIANLWNKTSGGDPNICVGPEPVSVNLAALWGEIKALDPKRAIQVAGSLLANVITRVDGTAINGQMTRDANLLFPFSPDKKKLAYSVSVCHGPSYYQLQRY
ncbi:MAG: hypothetical protein PHW04_14730 [Candidatus Wallbacteria bacterium]|nr:hypothetical protein [Candidatus Wallbacteria bacterium]